MTASLSKFTKAQLLSHIVELNQQLVNAGRTTQRLREQAAMAPRPSTAALPQSKETHLQYYQYVGAQRALAKARGSNLVSYKTFNQWVESTPKCDALEEWEREQLLEQHR